MTPRLVFSISVGLVLSAALSACASVSDAAPAGQGRTAALGAIAPALPEGEVIGQGTVIDQAGSAELCLGGVQESYPPQCAGVPLSGWTWSGLQGAETSGDVTWGAYAVQGTFDGSTITVTQPPILLALYDPMAVEDPTGGTAGVGTEAELVAIQDSLVDRLGADYLSSGPMDGRLWIDVVWDDGTYQTAADAEFGADMVIVRSALRPVG